MSFDFEEPLELGAAQSQARRPNYAYTFSEPAPKHKPGQKTKRNRGARRAAAAELAVLDQAEAELLEAQLGVAPAELPPHLRAYALQRRGPHCFSGPAVLPGEREAGRVEYKLCLLNPTHARFQQLVTQLNWRLSEGAGECLYALGVEDNGHPLGLSNGDLEASLGVLRDMAAEVGAVAEVLQTPPGSGEGRRCAVVHVARASAPSAHYDDLRLAVAGGVDSGKSTLVGVLCHGAGGAPALDNGRGSSRTQVFRHKHEVLSGHTSSISVQQCAYDAQGRVLNYCGVSSLSPAELAQQARRMARFFDLGGHERFSKTLLHGLTTLLPDCAMLCVSAASGVSWVTREHMAVALALGIPLLVAITKCDLATEEAVQQVVAEIRDLLAAAVQQGGGAVGDPAELAPLVHTHEQAAELAAGMHSSSVAAPGSSLRVPLFATSSVTGASLQLLHAFLSTLPPAGEGMQGWCGAAGGRGAPGGAHFQIDGSFEVAEVGTVYSGTVVSGAVGVGDELLLGPLEGGAFRRVRISSIHRSKVDVLSVRQGQHATLAVQPLEEAGGGGGSGAAAPDAPAPVEQQQGMQPPPSRADSAGCLAAWMQHTCSGQAALLQPSPFDSGREALPGSIQPPRPPSTPALTIAGAGLAGSRSTAQLSSSLQLPGSAELQHGWGSSPQLTPAGSGAAPRPRKGAVLLGPSLQPQACSQFEAVLVLLGGHWPARGLLSGCYPPDGEGDEPDAELLPPDGPGCSSLEGRAGASGSCDRNPPTPTSARRSGSLGKLQRTGSRRRGGGAYTPVVHCGSIRQAAEVVAMRELPRCVASPSASDGEDVEDPLSELLGGELSAEPSGGSGSLGTAAGRSSGEPLPLDVDIERLAGAVAAAGVLLPPALAGIGGASTAAGSRMASASSGSASGCEGAAAPRAVPAAGGAQDLQQGPATLARQRSLLPAEDIGCVASVTFSFMHQEEWLVEGARLVARDRTSGRVAGAGYVARIRPAAPGARADS